MEMRQGELPGPARTDLVLYFMSSCHRHAASPSQDPRWDRSLPGDTVHPTCACLWLAFLLTTIPCSIHLLKFVKILCVDHFSGFLVFMGLFF